MRLAEMLRDRLDQPERAAQVLEEMVKNNAASAPAYLARARYRVAAGASDDAQDLARAAALAPADAAVITANAELAERRGDLKAAREHWARGERLYPGEVRMCLGLAGAERKARRLPEAAACPRRGLGHNPHQTDLLLALVEVLTEQGDLAGAGGVIARLRGPPAQAAVAAYGEGLVLMQQGRWREAGDTLERAARAGAVRAAAGPALPEPGALPRAGRLRGPPAGCRAGRGGGRPDGGRALGAGGPAAGRGPGRRGGGAVPRPAEPAGRAGRRRDAVRPDPASPQPGSGTAAAELERGDARAGPGGEGAGAGGRRGRVVRRAAAGRGPGGGGACRAGGGTRRS